MWTTRDEFHFAFNKIKGDFIVRARIEFVGTGVDPHRKLGWIAMYERLAAIAVAWSYFDHDVPSPPSIDEYPIDSDASTTQIKWRFVSSRYCLR